MKNYATFNVMIPITTDSELYARLMKLAMVRGCDVDEVVDSVVQLGIYGHIEGNLSTYERAYGK